MSADAEPFFQVDRLAEAEQARDAARRKVHALGNQLHLALHTLDEVEWKGAPTPDGIATCPACGWRAPVHEPECCLLAALTEGGLR